MSQPEISQLRRPSQAESQTILKSEIPLKERFFRYFQHEITGMLHCWFWEGRVGLTGFFFVRSAGENGPVDGYFAGGW